MLGKTEKGKSAGPHSLALRLDVMGITAYMTKEAIVELAGELLRISAADPNQFYDIHVAMHFGGWNADGDYVAPSFGHHDGLLPIMSELRNRILKDETTDRDLEQGITPDMAYRPFDITIMHVTPEVVQKAVAENEPVETSRR